MESGNLLFEFSAQILSIELNTFQIRDEKYVSKPAPIVESDQTLTGDVARRAENVKIDGLIASTSPTRHDMTPLRHY